jgi:hypothetical protein
MCGLNIEMAHPRDRLTLTVEVILNTPHDERTAQTLTALLQIRPRQPMGADDAVIKRLLRLMIIDHAAEREAHRGDATLGASPQIDTNQRFRLETPCSFFASFANDRGKQRLSLLDVTGRLVEYQALVDAFFDYEEATVRFSDCGDGDFGQTGGGHARNYNRLAASSDA